MRRTDAEIESYHNANGDSFTTMVEPDDSSVFLADAKTELKISKQVRGTLTIISPDKAVTTINATFSVTPTACDILLGFKFQAPDTLISRILRRASARAKRNLHDALIRQRSCLRNPREFFERTSRHRDNPDECAIRAQDSRLRSAAKLFYVTWAIAFPRHALHVTYTTLTSTWRRNTSSLGPINLSSQRRRDKFSNYLGFIKMTLVGRRTTHLTLACSPSLSTSWRHLRRDRALGQHLAEVWKARPPTAPAENPPADPTPVIL